MPDTRPDDTRHECPKNGCTRMVAHDILACRAHWQQVSRPTQQAVYSAWRRIDTPGGLEKYLAVRADAVAEMNHPDRKPAKQVEPHV